MQAHLACAAPWPAPTQSLGRPFIAGVLLLEVNRELPLRVQPLSTSARGKIFSSSRHTGGPPAGTEACTPCSSLASFCGDAHKPAPLEPFPFSRGPRHAARPACGPGAMPGARAPDLTCARSSVRLLGTFAMPSGLAARPHCSAGRSGPSTTSACRRRSCGRCGRARGPSFGRAGHKRLWARASTSERRRSRPDGATGDASRRKYEKWISTLPNGK